MRASALDEEARLRRLTAALRVEVVHLGVDPVAAQRMPLERLLAAKRWALAQLMGAPSRGGS